MKPIILLFILAISFSLHAQQLSSQQQAFIKAFVKDMYIDTISYKEISKIYISEYNPTDKRMDSALSALVHLERNLKGDTFRANYNENNIDVQPYKDLRNKIKLENFDNLKTGYIIVILLKGNPSSYLYMQNNKIISFTYMKKGRGKDEPAYFVH